MSDSFVMPNHPKFKNLLNKRFGRLLVVGYAGRPKNQTEQTWLCLCDCGKEKTVRSWSLRSGQTQSCGCFQKERTSEASKKHGLSGTPEHRAWTQIMARCNPDTVKAKTQHLYVSRGIQMCEKWRSSFEAFLEDMGPKPHPLASVDRIDNDGNYEPGNCRWATPSQQARNRRTNHVLEFNGEKCCIAEWAERINLTQRTILLRLRRGWSVEEALSVPHKGSRHGKATGRFNG